MHGRYMAVWRTHGLADRRTGRRVGHEHTQAHTGHTSKEGRLDVRPFLDVIVDLVQLVQLVDGVSGLVDLVVGVRCLGRRPRSRWWMLGRVQVEQHETFAWAGSG